MDTTIPKPRPIGLEIPLLEELIVIIKQQQFPQLYKTTI